MHNFKFLASALNFSRRGVLKGVAATTAISAANSATLGTGKARAEVANNGHPIFGENPIKRKAQTFRSKLTSARRYLLGDRLYAENNGDEGLYADLRGSFHKCFVHNELGEVDPNSFGTLLKALGSANPHDFEAIQLDNSGVRTRSLVNPQGAFQFPDAGPDGQATRIRPAPAFASVETAAEMLEVYWKARLRDVPFLRFDTSRLVGRALEEINSAPFIAGINTPGGQHTLETVFRGETPGDRTGPYISQYLLHDVPYGNGSLEQRYPVPPRGGDYMTDFAEWLTVQRGGVPGLDARSGNVYIHDGRSLAEYVHYDFSYQAYLNAALIILSWGPDFFDARNPTLGSTTQEGFTTFGGPEVLDMIARAANRALAGAWYQKWLVNRRARPEVYGGRLHVQETGQKNYGIPGFLLDSLAVRRTKRQYGTYLLPMAYAEGSPVHPAYPAGHASVAGACATMLKAYFREDAIIPSPVEANVTGTQLQVYGGNLTVGGEINKLANNISLGRDWAGVHYRSDGIEGMNLGEYMAIEMLKDHTTLYNERFNGYSLTKFNGERIRIRGGEVTSLV